jgi:hypothetical protein
MRTWNSLGKEIWIAMSKRWAPDCKILCHLGPWAKIITESTKRITRLISIKHRIDLSHTLMLPTLIREKINPSIEFSHTARSCAQHLITPNRFGRALSMHNFYRERANPLATQGTISLSLSIMKTLNTRNRHQGQHLVHSKEGLPLLPRPKKGTQLLTQ